jgi:hypothetical protein
LKISPSLISKLSPRVKRVVKHSTTKMVKNDYDVLEVLDGDLALLELAESLEVGSNEAISAAVLPPPLTRHAGKPITVSGLSPDQESVDARIKTTLECLKNHPEGTFYDVHMF